MARTTKSAVASIAKQVVDKNKKKETVNKVINLEDFVSSGSTLLNLALTGNPFCGWQKGKMANLIGDSGAGKTLLALTALAEAAHDNRHDDMRLIYDDAENALEFDLTDVFGEVTEDRTEILDPPSNTIEEFSDNLADAIKEGSPFIYILDSFDAIGSDADTEHIESERKIRRGESKKESKGSYGMAKPKLSSQLLREDCGKLKRAKGALLIVSQTRDNLTPGSFEKKTRSGGKALKFYATHEVWIILTGSITVKKRRIGADCLVKVTKNKVTGKRRSIKFSVYDEYGVDDIGSMIDFLLEESAWSGGGASKINTNGDFDEAGTKDPKSGKITVTRGGLIKFIEDHSKQKKLKNIVGRVWNEIEESLKPKRVSKYS